MVYKLVVSKEAIGADIDDMVHYILSELNNPSAASAFLDDAEKSYQF